MATTEERVDKLETRFSTLEQQVATIAEKVDMLVAESQQQRKLKFPVKLAGNFFP